MFEEQDRTKQIFEELLKCGVGDANTLKNIYKANRNYMSPDVIDAIVTMGTKRTFTVSEFAKCFSKIMSLPVFEMYSNCTPGDERHNHLQAVLCEYLKALSAYKHKNFAHFKNNIFYWLKSKIEQPITNTMNPTVCRVNVKSSYKPEEGAYVTVFNDLVRKSTEQVNLMANATVHPFHYTPRTASVQMLPHTTLHGIVSNLVNLQTVMNREALAQNMKLAPFLDIVPNRSTALELAATGGGGGGGIKMYAS